MEFSKNYVSIIVDGEDWRHSEQLRPEEIEVGGLIGAAATEEENQAEQSFNHGKISVDTDYYERPRRSAGARTRAAA